MLGAFSDVEAEFGVTRMELVCGSYVVVSGLSKEEDHATRLCRFAKRIGGVATEFHAPDGSRMQLCIGIHSGPGTIGETSHRIFLGGRNRRTLLSSV